jgi:N-acetylmuramoyl-L-alanine amidase
MLDSKNMIEKDDTLASVLLDLSQTAAKEASQNIGSKVLKSFKNVGHLHRTAVQKACFVVLKSPDIPSILVETAFISNPDEEQRLTNSAYQEKMASAVFAGIMAHFKQYAPANTLLAQQSKSIRSARLQGAEMPEPSAQNQIPAEAIPVSRHRLNS